MSLCVRQEVSVKGRGVIVCEAGGVSEGERCHCV